MKILTIVGARPQFIKAATVSRAIRKHNELNRTIAKATSIAKIIVHTGQHFDDNMSGVFFTELAIPTANYNLGIGGGSHGQNTGRMIEAIEAVLLDEKPDWVLVYGDTNSTLAGALAAVKLHIPVAHVEAGLRSYNRRMPEEINRILTDQISSLLFCPTQSAMQNLAKEGFPQRLSATSAQKIVNVGDVMYDAALFYADMAKEKSRVLSLQGLQPKDYVLATIHRAENTDNPDRLSGIVQALNQIATDLPVILPLHPRTAKKLKMLAGDLFSKSEKLIQYIDPVGYLDMVTLEKNARVIITDSGGVQKEAYFHGVPCVTVREETEWVELVDAGVNCLAGADCTRILEAYQQMKNQAVDSENLYGAGDSAGKIVAALVATHQGDKQ